MWASTKPRTRAVGRAPLNGCPLTFTSTSGNVAQPCAAAKDQRGAVESDLDQPARRAHAEVQPVDTFVSRSVPPPSATRQSAAGPGVAVGVIGSSSADARHAPSGP